MSLVAVAEATHPNLNKLLPEVEVFKKSKLPAVPEQTTLIPCSLDLPAKITSATAVLIPAETFPAGSPTAVIEVMVLKYEDPVAVPAFAPVMDSVSASPLTSVPTTVNEIPESSQKQRDDPRV